MIRRAIIGVGSAHGDDQLGWYVIDQLQKINIPNIALEKVNSPASTLLQSFQRYDFVVIVDACDMGRKVGEIIEGRADQLEISGSSGLSSHDLGVAEAFLLAQQLGIALPEIKLLMVQLGQVCPMQQMSDEVLNIVPDVVEKVLNYLQVSQPEVHKCIN